MTSDVVIVQRRLTHYRLPLFDQLRQLLAQQGVGLRLLHGEPTAQERSKNDSGHLPWATQLPTRYFAGGKLMWQPFMQQSRGAQLVIVTQENKHLHNIPAMLDPWRRHRMAFWGHGRNMQAGSAGALREGFKRWMTNRPDWWFAYTDLSREFVAQAGFPDDRITVLNNSVDTSTLRQEVNTANALGAAALRTSLGLGPGPLAVFIGSLYDDKRLPFLIDTADRLRQRVPGFQLAIAGAGPDQGWVVQAAASRPHVHYLGPLFGAQKARLLAASDVMLNPGLVGLGILDAFVAGIPMLTTDCRIHSPEIAYLAHGQNGLMTANSLDAYATASAEVLNNRAVLDRLKAGALASGHQYSVQNMAQNFCDGICQALQRA